MGKSAAQFLEDARRGREAAFLRLFDDHHLPLFRFACRLTGSAADAEDIVQECFLALLRPECAFDPKRTAIRTYLFGAVRNQALKLLRRREQGEPPDSPDRRTPERDALRGEVAAAVARAIAELPDTQRDVLLLAHYEQLPLAEIAEILELEVAAVKSRLQRARATLRETLAAWAPGAERTI
ncbi:MAG TPA: RNA polymerase sigma factor [Candidatus Sulfopaludibacter sp.]|nr:RNA polymerase sigma factor [Candidatus Sulfopaludibacter sp.]